MPTYASREEIDERYRWDLSSIFPDDQAFLAALEKAKELPERFASLQGIATRSAADLLSFLRFDDEADLLIMKLVNYAERKSDEDTREARYQDLSSQVMTIYVQISSASSWFTSELISLSDETLEGYFAAEPDLELYRRCLEMLRRNKDHVLSPAEEKLLASAGDMAGQAGTIFSLLNDADLTFEDALDATGSRHPVTHGSYVPLMMSTDRILRESAYRSLYKSFGQFRNTFAATLAAQNKKQLFYSQARHYDSPLEQSLSANEVPVEVYTTLIETVHENLGALHDYIALRKRIFAVDELRFSDLYVPIVEDIDLTYTYEQACELILAALEPMGPEYLALVKRCLDERWIDVYETPGKRSGAYSAGGAGMHPVILMNFQGKLDDVFTLIHEMGHSIHTYLSCENQPTRYSDYVIFVAEVASTCNEALLTRYLLDHAADEKQRAYFLNHFLEQFRATLYRQTMFAEFELEVSKMAQKGVGITADALCSTYRALNEAYFGPEITVDDEIALEWARIPHFYYEFYVYQYATGFAAAIALSQRILSEGEPARNAYLSFLKSGSSKPPIELLRDAGVDMRGPAAVESALRLFGESVAEMADVTTRLQASTQGERA